MTARLAALTLAFALLATGCGVRHVGDPHYTPTIVEMPDGRTVECVTYKQGYAGGLSCDWDNAR